MKNILLSIMNDLSNSFKLIKGILLSEKTSQEVVAIPVQSSLKHPQIMNKDNKAVVNTFSYHTKTLFFVFAALIMSVSSLKAQIINEGFEEAIWTNFGTGPGASTYGSVVQANVPANSIMSYLTLGGASNFTTAVNTCNNSGTWFFSKATSQSSTKFGQGAHSISHSVKISGGGYIITPVTPAAVVNITFWAANTSGSIVAGLATDPAAAAPGYNTSTTNAPGAYTYATSSYPSGPATMQSFSFGGTFSGPCRFGIFNPGGTIYVDDIMVYAPTGNPPTVTTNSVSPAITNAQVNATVTLGATPALPLLASGIIWSTTPLTGTVADTLKPKTRDIPAATGSFTDLAGPLTANTTYYAEAYIIGLDGSLYFGAALQFTTLNISAPTVATSTPSSVLSYSAVVGGSVPDSGGCVIIKKGVCYGLSANPTVAGSKTIDGIYGTPYTSSLSPLSPNQTYHYRAYAYNSCFPNVVSYGGDSTFTTGPAVPSLITIPGSINFGTKYINSNPIALSYILKGFNLTPNGTITVSAPAGYTVSTNSAGPFTQQTITFGYAGNSFSKPIYVQLATGKFGVFSGSITHSGGGAVAPYVDAEFVTGTIVQSPTVLSNMGTDFWTGFGCEENMRTATTQFDTATTSAKGAHFSLYIATDSQAATVLVEMPGLPGAVSFPRIINIPKYSVTEVGGFPIGDGTNTNASGAPDARLYTTGVSSRGIHVSSTNGVPVACWLYDWATNNSAGGAMMFPTNTWNSSYAVQAYGGTTSNTGFPNSFFFVITNDDNTVLTITPTADIIDSASSSVITKAVGGTVLHPKGVTYTVTLPHKGDVYNAMGLVDASTNVGYDLTGTKVSTDCSKKIAVFAGNARSLINTASCNGNSSGSDNLIQQMFPKVAWGKTYLTVPTKNMEFNMYRISVADPTTVVKLSGTVISSTLWNATGSFYEYGTNKSVEITADKPISVTQFIMPGSSCGGASVGNSGTGDPEMILLSPIEQAITRTTVFCPGFKDGTSGGTYINVIIPTAGVSCFSIDGKTGTAIVDTGTSSYATAYGVSNCQLNKAFKPHPADPTYSWAKFHVSYPAPHTLTSSVAFNAIAYGTSKGESWGFNAGTSVKNLTKIDTCLGPCHLDGGIVTCVNNSLTLQVALAYQPSDVDSIVWYTGTNIFVSPFNTSTTGAIDAVTHSAQYVGTIVQNGETFYVYSCPIPYTFTAAGIYDITATAMGKFASDCPGISTNHIYVTVGNDVPSFTAIPVGCGSKDVTFTDASSAISGASIVKWDWNFGDGTPNSTITNTANPNPTPNPHTYPSLTKYTAILTTTNSYGCVASDSVAINLAFSLTSGFTKDRDTMCPGSTVTFTDTSSSNAAVWNWHFGEAISGAYDSSHLQNPTHLYTDSGRHIISLQVFSAAGCPGNIFYDTVYVTPKPKADFVLPLGVCLPGNTVFTNSTNPVYGAYTSVWTFGDTSKPDTSKNPIHQFPNQTPPAGGYPVKLVVTTAFGCVSDTTVKNVSNVFTKPTADFTIAKADICLGSKAVFNDNNNSTATNQTINQWHWFFGDGRDTITTTNASPHIYTTLGTDSVKLVIQTDKGCVSDTSVAHAIKINPLPTAAFIVPGSCLTGGSVTFTDKSSVTPDDGTNQPFTYSWVYDPATPSATGTTKDGLYQYTATGTYQVSQTVTTAHGCSNTVTQPFVIAGSKPRPYFYVNHKDSLCNGFAVTITDTSRIDIGTIGRVDIVWDAVGNPGTVVTVANPGNGKPGASTNYTHTYPGTGTFFIKLIAYAGTTTGCNDSVTLITPITIYPQPTAAFIVPGSCLTSGSSVVFTDQSSITPDDGTNKPFTYHWVYNVLPGDTGNTANGTYSYTKVGLYDVTQTVTSKHGCTNSIKQQFDIAGTQPVPAFYVNPKSLCSNVPVTITDTSRIAIGVIKKVEIYWNYSPGMSVPDVTDNNPSNGAANSSKNYTYSYPVLGTDKVYNIRLVAYSGATCFHDTVITVTVHGTPKIFFSALSDICLNATPLTITQATQLSSLTGTFTYLGPTGTIIGNTFDPSKLLPYVPNTYNIKAIFTTVDGCADTTPANPIRVLGLPKAYPVVSNRTCEKRNITFSDTSNPMGGIITSQTWVINGNIYTGSPVPVAYPAATNDVVMLVVKTSIGCSSDTAKLPVIINPLPNVDFTIQASTCLPKGTTQFTDSTKLPGAIQPQFNWVWTFGDSYATPPNPDFAVVQNPTHNFTVIGDYNITLKVVSAAGCDSSLTKVLYGTQIHPAPIASFTTSPSPAKVCLGDGIVFTDNSTGPVKKSIFKYGDGTIDTTISENYIYKTATSYTAMHSIIDFNNCPSVNNPTVPVLIDPIPTVYAGLDKFLVVGDSVVLNDVLVNANNFTNWWSSGNANQYLNDPTILNPVFNAIDSGTFTYTLNIKSQAGCTARDNINITVLNPPYIPNAFSPNGDGFHDKWEIGFLNKYPGATVKVFNRYGQLIYNVIGYFEPWDGKVNGGDLPIGTYYY
ncbi:MAG: PKD domain-containing protein, partial [Bacteroidota bacterium]